MPKKYDLVNKKFGMLTVEKLSGRGHDRCFHWICKCDCGNTIEVSTWELNNGKITNCGCMTNKPKKLDNRRFGHLVVLQKDGHYKRLSIWLCRCDCGNEIKALAHQLKSGLVTSCGCSGGGPLPFTEKPKTHNISKQSVYDFVRSLGVIRLKC